MIHLSYIQKKMEKWLFTTYTLHELLDELDMIEYFMKPGKASVQNESIEEAGTNLPGPGSYAIAGGRATGGFIVM